jgi:hypothetical protein
MINYHILIEYLCLNHLINLSNLNIFNLIMILNYYDFDFNFPISYKNFFQGH